MAFGGTRNNSQAYANNRGGNGRYTYAFASHPGWNTGRQYNWGGHRYGWYDNAWYIINPYPYYGGYPYDSYGSGSVSVQVQQSLAQDGYYQGPIDGVVGPGTQAAIAAYQRDNGLRVTGNITHGLLNSLGIG